MFSPIVPVHGYNSSASFLSYSFVPFPETSGRAACKDPNVARGVVSCNKDPSGPRGVLEGDTSSPTDPSDETAARRSYHELCEVGPEGGKAPGNGVRYALSGAPT
jgi:hypothetical protein